jgi:predicted TIM-barrel fold metal-dependent hydrolase
MLIYNCHTHIFTSKNVPDKFLPAYLRPVSGMLRNYNVTNGLMKLLKSMGRGDLSAKIRRYYALLNIGSLPTQESIFQFLQGFYPASTRFVALSMDMEYMQAGKLSQSFEDQLKELADLKRNPHYRDYILPFISVHPERPNIYDLVRRYIEEEGFAGLKLYPPLGYYPFDERLYKVYEYAQQNNIPIMTHCARGGVYSKSRVDRDSLVHPRSGQRLIKSRPVTFTDYYTDPENYTYLLKDFPNLKICFGHYGGGDEWEKYLAFSWHPEKDAVSNNWYSKIGDLMRAYPNVYADISYTLCDKRFFNMLKVTLQDSVLRNRVLYGSDFYMLEQELSEREFSINLRAFLGDDDYRQIAETNPVAFLRKHVKIDTSVEGDSDLTLGNLW